MTFLQKQISSLQFKKWKYLHFTSYLSTIYDGFNSTYEELLASHNDISIHQKHLKHLAIEVHKFLANLSPELM